MALAAKLSVAPVLVMALRTGAVGGAQVAASTRTLSMPMSLLPKSAVPRNRMTLVAELPGTVTLWGV